VSIYRFSSVTSITAPPIVDLPSFGLDDFGCDWICPAVMAAIVGVPISVITWGPDFAPFLVAAWTNCLATPLRPLRNATSGPTGTLLQLLTHSYGGLRHAPSGFHPSSR
jgi:hypothetical protein